MVKRHADNDRYGTKKLMNRTSIKSRRASTRELKTISAIPTIFSEHIQIQLLLLNLPRPPNLADPLFLNSYNTYLYYSSWPLSTYCHALYFKCFMFIHVISNAKQLHYKKGPYFLLVCYSAHRNLCLTEFSAKSKSSISNY